MSESPVAKRLSEASVVMEGTPHPELVAMLRIGGEEVQRLWDIAEKRYYAIQRLEGEVERLEAALVAATELLNRNFPFPYDPKTYAPFYEKWTADRRAWLACSPSRPDNLSTGPALSDVTEP